MHELIITRILNRGVVTLTELESRATERGFSLSDLHAALDKVHRDKRIVRSTSKGEIVYKPAPKRSEVVNTHVTWVKENYPWPDADWQEPFPEIDLGAMFLRTKEERDAYMAEASGRPVYMTKKKYGR